VRFTKFLFLNSLQAQDESTEFNALDSHNFLVIDHLPTVYIDSATRLRRLIDARKEEMSKLHQLCHRMRQVAVEVTPEVKKTKTYAEMDKEIHTLRLANKTLTERLGDLSETSSSLKKENADLLELIKRNEERHQLEKEQQELLISNLRNSIQNLTNSDPHSPQALMVEEQDLLMSSLKEDIARLAMENVRLQDQLKIRKDLI
jgi:hypothetical protein